MQAWNFAAQARKQLLADALQDDAAHRVADAEIKRMLADKIGHAVHFQIDEPRRIGDAEAPGIDKTISSLPQLHLPFPVITVSSPLLSGEQSLVIAEKKHLDNPPEEALELAGLVCACRKWIIVPRWHIVRAVWEDVINRRWVHFMSYPDLFRQHGVTEEMADQKTYNSSVPGSAYAPLWQLLETLARDRVVVRTIQTADETVNRKRERKGKLPLYTIKILTVPGNRVLHPNLGGHHASPAEHLRQGHWRTLPPRGRRLETLRVHVKACKVGDRANGFVAKEYRLKAPPNSH